MITKDRIRQILEDHHICEFSEKHIDFLFRLSLHPENLAPLEKSRKQKLEELQNLIKQATALSDALKKYYPWLEGHHEDIFLPVLGDWITRWGKSIDYLKQQKDPSGPHRKKHNRIFYALCLINLYERATGENYVKEEVTNWGGRERNAYDLRCYAYLKAFIKEAFPDADPVEILKLARRDALLSTIFADPDIRTLLSE
jgi:predicted glycoside hydrolase/deacetylase ChbG (UPF0249 family)